MRITDISIERSLVDVGTWKFELEINACRFTGYFADFGGFITMIAEATKFFAIRAGKLRVKDANLTRAVAPGVSRH
jgi:hypothetical protein